MAKKKIIEVRDLHKTYVEGNSATAALRGVSLSVNQGDFLAISGPSGSGKSTLLNILGFLDAPTSGKVFLDGNEVHITDFDSMADFRVHRLGFIFQSFNLVPVLSARENIMIPLMLREDLSPNEKKERVQYLLDKVGLAKKAEQKPDELSGGQKQRVAVARALVCHPSFVLADEPTANLDTENSESILELMREMNKEMGTAFVFSTHDPLIMNYAERKILLRDGQIVS